MYPNQPPYGQQPGQQPPYQGQPQQPPYGQAPYPGQPQPPYGAPQGQPGYPPQEQAPMGFGGGVPMPMQPGAPGYPPAGGMPYPAAPGGVAPPYGQMPGAGYPGAPAPGGYPPGAPGAPGCYPPATGAYPTQAVPGAGVGTLRLQLSAVNLKNKDVGGASDPFFTISRADGGGKAAGEPVHKSEVVHENLSPVWQPLTTSVARFCDGDYHRRLRVDIFDHDPVGKDDSMGHVLATLRELMDARATGRKFPVQYKSMGILRSAGDLHVVEATVWQENLPT